MVSFVLVFNLGSEKKIVPSWSCMVSQREREKEKKKEKFGIFLSVLVMVHGKR